MSEQKESLANVGKSAGKGAELKEFLRYALVGGIAFLVDFGVFWLFRDVIFAGKDTDLIIVISTTAGFIVGITVNYLLSMRIVFTTEKQQEQGKNARAVLIFIIVGLIGLGLTNLLQWLGEAKLLVTEFGKKLDELLFDQGKLLVRCVVSGIVLIWNYVGRKVLVFKK